jgi:L-malate glycosyltransferase
MANRLETPATGHEASSAATRDEARRAGPIRVLMVAPSLDILGGQAVQASRLRDRLAEYSSVEISFQAINPRLPGPLGFLQSVKYVRTIVTTLLYVAMLAVRVRRCDVLHVYSASNWSFLLAPTPAILFGKLYGKKVVLDYHSGEIEEHLQNWGKTAVPTIALADVVATPSDFVAEALEWYGVAEARTIPNFIDTRPFRFRERGPLRPVFLTNRLLEPLYNVGCVLRAFRLVQERYPEARLVVGGHGPERVRLERLTDELGLRNVVFAGRTPPERMPDQYAEAEVYLMATKMDCMPLSVLEAFASGLPVVATRVGGVPYLIADGETGLLVESDDHEAMADAAVRLLEDEALARAVARRAREVCGRYTAESVLGAWVSLYSELAPERGATRERLPAEG